MHKPDWKVMNDVFMGNNECIHGEQCSVTTFLLTIIPMKAIYTTRRGSG